MKWICAPSLIVAGIVVLGAQEPMPSADAVLAELKAGNAHLVAKKYEHPHQTAARQQSLASSQSPHCAILTCADSRVPPELIFDKGSATSSTSAWRATSRETTRWRASNTRPNTYTCR